MPSPSLSAVPDAPADQPQTLGPPAVVVGVLAWVLPGLGYWVIGERARALWAGGAILGLFLLCVLVAGVRVIDPPGYDAGRRVMLGRGEAAVWALSARPVPTLLQKPAYLGQALVGPVTFVGTAASLSAARYGRVVDEDDKQPFGQRGTLRRPVPIERTSAKLEAPAMLGTAVAGMLNLMVIVDSVVRRLRAGRVAGAGVAGLSEAQARHNAGASA